MNLIFETDRLYIIEISSEQDISDLFEIYKNKENLIYLNNSDFDWTINNLKLKLLLYRKYYKVGYGIFVARLKDTNELIAEVSIFNSFEDLKLPEIGYIINKPYWNNKFGTEIVSALVSYLLQKDITGIYSRMNLENSNSAKICFNLGFEELSREVLKENIVRQTLYLKK